ncbi:MAG: hypothetical protein J7L30_03495 [Methanophagales archaeon]|nr:hypothetical protein [Methanophagales archaeon]
MAENVRSQRRHEEAKMECVLEQSLIFILALILDLTVGDPPEGVDRFYPIVWISRLMSFFDRRTKRGNPAKERALGISTQFSFLCFSRFPALLSRLFATNLLAF